MEIFSSQVHVHVNQFQLKVTNNDADENPDSIRIGAGVPEVWSGLERDLPGKWPVGQSAGEYHSPDPEGQVQGHYRQ